MIDSLGEAVDEGWRLYVACDRRRAGLKSVRACTGRAELDLGSIVWTHGRACPIGFLDGRLKCPGCGSRHVRLIWVAPPNRGLQVRG